MLRGVLWDLREKSVIQNVRMEISFIFKFQGLVLSLCRVLRRPSLTQISYMFEPSFCIKDACHILISFNKTILHNMSYIFIYYTVEVSPIGKSPRRLELISDFVWVSEVKYRTSKQARVLNKAGFVIDDSRRRLKNAVSQAVSDGYSHEKVYGMVYGMVWYGTIKATVERRDDTNDATQKFEERNEPCRRRSKYSQKVI